MTAEFTAEEIMEITGARLALGMMPDDAAPIFVDTREMPENAWFIALAGAEFDGHDFLGDAFAQGALGCIVSERSSYPIASTSFPLLAVDDTEAALASLARNWRRRLSLRLVIAIASRADGQDEAGSSCFEGMKTSYRTKRLNLRHESMHAVLNAVLQLDEESQAVVLDICPRTFEELQICVRSLIPNVLIVTTSGLDNLGMSCSVSDFKVGLSTVVEAVSPKSTLIVANSRYEVNESCQSFSGRKIFLENEVAPDSGENADVWAGSQAVKILVP